MEYPEEELQSYDDGSTGVALEDDNSGTTQEPFDPTEIRIAQRPSSLDNLVTRIKHDELNLSPDFQRKMDLWSNGAQSRLIESLLIHIPIPAFYFDATDEGKWVVVDGVQRLTALARFVLDDQKLKDLGLEKLTLCELDFLTNLNGRTFDELERIYQRRINETQVTVHTIEQGTHPDVKYNIFKRINTGGLPLSRQEIRNALNAGEATKLLNELTRSKEFLDATNHSIRGGRGEDQECVLRFIAFTLSPYTTYNEKGGFHEFLNDTMARMNKLSLSERTVLKKKFKKAMITAHEIFGEAAFRRVHDGIYSGPIYRTLFEVWSVNIGQLSNDDISKLIKKKGHLLSAFRHLLSNRDFSSAISVRNVNDVKIRFEKVEKFIKEILQTQEPWKNIENPWKNIENKYPIGKRINGKIVNIVEYGAFAELEEGITGLIHNSELSWTERYADPKNFFNVGDEVDVVVLAVDPGKWRISLSYRQTKPDPWKKYSVGSIVRGTIIDIVEYGAFAELEEGIKGLIHISQLERGWTEKVEDVVSVGEELDLEVIDLDLDVNNRYIYLSLKAMRKEQP